MPENRGGADCGRWGGEQEAGGRRQGNPGLKRELSLKAEYCWGGIQGAGSRRQGIRPPFLALLLVKTASNWVCALKLAHKTTNSLEIRAFAGQ